MFKCDQNTIEFSGAGRRRRRQTKASSLVACSLPQIAYERHFEDRIKRLVSLYIATNISCTCKTQTPIHISHLVNWLVLSFVGVIVVASVLSEE